MLLEPVDPIGEVRTREEAHDVAGAIASLSGASGRCEVTPYVVCAVLLVTGLLGSEGQVGPATSGALAAFLRCLGMSLSRRGDLRGAEALGMAAGYMDSMARGLAAYGRRASA